MAGEGCVRGKWSKVEEQVDRKAKEQGERGVKKEGAAYCAINPCSAVPDVGMK